MADRPTASVVDLRSSGGSQITAQDVEDARSVRTSGQGHQFEIQLGHLCNNRCVFCSSGQLTALKLARHIPLDPMVEAIESARAAGARRVTFLGGEPTLHKGFFDALARSVELGFEEIVIFTNGVMLPHPGFIDRVLSLDFPFEWRISIQGGDEAAHVAVTGRKDSFQRILEGLRTLRERGQRVTANMCVNERSYRSLPLLPDLVREHGLKQFHIDVVRPSSTGERTEAYLREIMPRYSEMAPYIAQMFARFEAEDPDFDVHVGNLPLCILPEWAHRIHHGGDETVTKSCDHEALEEEVDKYAWHTSMRRHVPRCEGCALKPRCSGAFETYLALYGDGELQPVSQAALMAAPNSDALFELSARPFFERLERALGVSPPEGFELARWVPRPHDRLVEAALVGDEGEVGLELRPPSCGEGATLRTDRFALRVSAPPTLSTERLAQLLGWLVVELDAIEGCTREPFAVGPVLEDHHRRRVEARRQDELQTLARHLQVGASFARWQVARTVARAEGLSVDLRREGGARVELAFAFREAAAAKLSMSARPGPGVSEAEARAVAAEVGRSLRAPNTP